MQPVIMKIYNTDILIILLREAVKKFMLVPKL